MILTLNLTPDWGKETTENFAFLKGFFNFLDDTNSRATVFIQASIAEKLMEIDFPKKVEIASLGFSGKDLSLMKEEDAIEEMITSKKTLESIFKRKVNGFRAPYFKTFENFYLLLRNAGYSYSSSLVKGFLPKRYSHLKIPEGIVEKEGVKEIPIQKMRILPFAFGFPFYKFFYPLSRLLIPKNPLIFYYGLTELVEFFPGNLETWPARLALSIRKGRKARKILYPLLKKFAPTESIGNFLRKQ